MTATRGRPLRAARAFAAVLGLIALLFAAPVASAGPAKKQVLILNSYDPAYGWTANIMRGAQSVFDAMENVELSIEFMDSKKVFTPEYAKLLSEVYARKYGSMHFDLILSSDDDALDFLKIYRDQLFPGVPVVFSGVNDFRDSRIAGFTNVTGVNESQDYDRSIEWVTRLRPQTQQLVFIADQTATGVSALRQIQQVEPRWRNRFSFDIISNVTMAELEEKLRALPQDAVVFWSMFMRDRDNVPFSMRESHRRIVAASPVPVFGFSDTSVLYGAAGGYVVSGFSQGETAARLGVQVLAGTPADQIPIVRRSPNVYMVDDPTFRRWHLDQESIPPDAVVLNKPFSFYQRYRSYVWAALGGMGTETLAILALLATIRTLTRKSRAKLRESEERYRSIVEDGSELICRFDREGKVLFANGALARLLQMSPEKLVGLSFFSLFTEHADTAGQKQVGLLTPVNPVVAVEQSSVNGKGQQRWVLWTLRGLFNDGKLTEVQAVGHDISARREAESAVRAALQEVERGHADLGRANQSLQGVLDSMREGLVLCDRQGLLASAHSKAAAEWFGTPAERTYIWDYLFDAEAEAEPDGAKDRFRVGFEQLAEDFMPFEVAAEQVPPTFRRGERTFRIEFHQVMRDGKFAELVLTIADVTVELEQARRQKYYRELPAIVGNLLRDREGFHEFAEEIEQLLGRLGASSDRVELRRLIHTLKGNTAIWGFEVMAATCHSLESAIEADDNEPTPKSIEALTHEWSRALDNVKVFLDNEGRSSVRLDSGEYEALLRRLEARDDSAEIALMVRAWANPPMQQVLGIYGRTVRQLGARFHKEVEPQILDHGLRLPSAEMRGFLGVLVHVVRNAVDHGLEIPEERERAGKPRAGRITVESRIEGSHFVVAVGDDGRGIDWEGVRKMAQARSLPAATEQDLIDAIFTDGLTTRDVVSDISGRGVGLASVRQTCEQLGGVIRVSTQKGRGATFEFRFALDSLAHASDSKMAAAGAKGIVAA